MNEVAPSSFYLYLPSNASTATFPENGPSGYTVVLPNPLELYGEWEVALASFVYPNSWYNIIAPLEDKIEPNHIGKFLAMRSVDRRADDYKDKPGYYKGWIPIHLAPGNYKTIRDVMRGIDRALRKEFGDDVVNEEWQIKEVDAHTEVKIKKISGLALNRYLYTVLNMKDRVRRLPLTIIGGVEYSPIDDDFPEPTTGQSDSSNYLVFGWDEFDTAEEIPNEADYADYRVDHNVNDKVNWFIAGVNGASSFQTIYIYSDVVGTQIVGDVRANVLRVIAPRGETNDIINENFSKLFYTPVRLNRISKIEVLLRGDTGKAISFKGGVVTITLHFRKKKG